MKPIHIILVALLFILVVGSGSRTCNNLTRTPSIFVYYRGMVEHCQYANLVGGSNMYGFSPDCQVQPYGGDFFSTHWEVYKKDIDSVVIEERNFWTDGLPRKKEIKDCKYPAIDGKDTIWIKIIDRSK